MEEVRDEGEWDGLQDLLGLLSELTTAQHPPLDMEEYGKWSNGMWCT